MFSVYDVREEKPFTLDALAQAELEFDWFYSRMSPEQCDYYRRAAIEIGEREAARYRGQEVVSLTKRLGANVYEPVEVVKNGGIDGPYAEYDAKIRQITVHPAGVHFIAGAMINPMVRTIPDYARWNETTKNTLMQLARELLIAHELFHHLEATSLGPVHRTLPPMSVSLLGGFWKARRYVQRTREIAAHSFAFTLLGMNERFPWTIDYTSTDRR